MERVPRPPSDPRRGLGSPALDGLVVERLLAQRAGAGPAAHPHAPDQPNFDGPVFVVVDGRSASATELAADGFRASGLATLVGERTRGHMLSQAFFDVAEGFVVSLPVADYHSAAHGRIGGVGVPVDVEVPSGEALERAKSLARDALGRGRERVDGRDTSSSGF